MSKNDVTKKQRESIEKATREFEKQQAEIKPFIKTKKMTVPSTAGKWQIDTAIQSENHFGCLELDAYGHELKEDKELEEQLRVIVNGALNGDGFKNWKSAKTDETVAAINNLIAQERRKAKIVELSELLEFISYDEGFEPTRQVLQDRIAELKEELEDE